MICNSGYNLLLSVSILSSGGFEKHCLYA